MSTFIVTGGAGFIGSEFVRALSDKNHKIIIVDKLTYAGDVSRLSLTEDITFLHEDICNISSRIPELRKSLEDTSTSYLVNFAAESHVDRSISNSIEFYRTNLLGTQNLLNLASEIGIKHFVQVGTDEVYGSLDKSAANESFPLNPASPYSASKAAADLAVLAHSITHGLKVSISRACNTFGQFQLPEKLIPRSIVLAMSGKPIEIYGAGLQIREWISVQQHVQGILKICERGASREIYNLGSGIRFSNLELIAKVSQILKQNSIDARIEFVGDRPGHDFRYALDSSKANRDIEFDGSEDFDQELEKTVFWYLENREWWETHLPESTRIKY